MLGIIFAAWNLNGALLRLLTRGMGMRLGQGRALATVMATEFAICAIFGGILSLLPHMDTATAAATVLV